MRPRAEEVKESPVCNMVKCKDIIKNAVKEASPRAMDNIVKVTHDLYVPAMEKAVDDGGH